MSRSDGASTVKDGKPQIRPTHELTDRRRRMDQEPDSVDALKWRVAQDFKGRGDDNDFVAA